MQANPSSHETEAAKRSPFSSSRLGVAAKRLGLGLAWLVIWVMTLMVSAELVERFYLHQNQQEGFAASLVLMGVFMLGPLGFLASILTAQKTRRRWLFLVGAAVTGIGTVAFLLFAFT